MARTKATTLTLLATLLTLTTSIPHAHPRRELCTKASLSEAVNAYLTSQTAGTLTALNPYLAPNFTYEENNVVIPHTTGILHKPLHIEHNLTIHDLTTCTTFTEVVAPTGPYVLGTQLHHTPSGKITHIDTITSTTGSWLFNATATLVHATSESWPEIPLANRSSRAAIQAAGDAYMDMWSDPHAHERVPWGMPCRRLEGGAYTGNGSPDDSCATGIPSNHSQAPNSRRRYVVDETMGSVSVLCVWEHMMNAADSHLFRLEGGKLRFVHTVTSCGGKVCRL